MVLKARVYMETKEMLDKNKMKAVGMTAIRWTSKQPAEEME
jgi:hypothetical protein